MSGYNSQKCQHKQRQTRIKEQLRAKYYTNSQILLWIVYILLNSKTLKLNCSKYAKNFHYIHPKNQPHAAREIVTMTSNFDFSTNIQKKFNDMKSKFLLKCFKTFRSLKLKSATIEKKNSTVE